LTTGSRESPLSRRDEIGVSRLFHELRGDVIRRVME
jgi:hypothetical protein